MTGDLHARQPIPGRGWRRVREHHELPPSEASIDRAGYVRGTVTVISDLVMAELPTGDGVGHQWLLSISRSGRRARPGDVRRALEDFGMSDAEQDNHEPGVHKSFWLPVDPAHRVDCECKATDELVVEADGHEWSKPRPGHGECGGCRREKLGLGPCTVHTTKTARIVQT